MKLAKPMPKQMPKGKPPVKDGKGPKKGKC